MNEFLLLLTICAELVFVLIASRMGKNWLRMTIVVNLILIATFGAKIIPAFSFLTNSGNVFYAGVFLAMHMIIEQYGKRSAMRSMWIGFGSMVFFLLMSMFAVSFIGSKESLVLNQAIDRVFVKVPRIALASMIAYLASQYANIWLYSYMLKKNGRKQLWLRDNLANIAGQMVDSVMFFSIAFLQILTLSELLQAIIIGYGIKVVTGSLGTVFLYMSVKPKHQNL